MPYKNLQSLMKKTDERCVKAWIAGFMPPLGKKPPRTG
jgi:hypothetical protein